MKNFLRKNDTLNFLLNITSVYEKTRFDSQFLISQLTKRFKSDSISHASSVTKLGSRLNHLVVFHEDDLFFEFHCYFACFIQFFNCKLKKNMIRDPMVPLHNENDCMRLINDSR